ncbi:hypothetical protein AOLI_G00180690 [Acnodon oligacanthus]
MDRPARNRKTVSYSDFLDDDDEDFATVKGPPNKKARASVKEPHHESNRETPSNSPKEMDAETGKGFKERVFLDEKLHKRDLEAALRLSLLQSVEKLEEPLTNGLEDEKCQPPVLIHCSMDGSCLEDDTSSNHLLPQDSPPVLSNCSVDVNCLGLDQITCEQTPSRQKKTSKTRQPQKRVLQDKNDSAGDEDYKSQNTPESDTDFSDPDESKDEKFSVKGKGEKKKTSRNEKKTAPKAAKKERNTPKLPKATQKSAVGKTALSRSPGVTQDVPAQKRSPITPPMPKLSLCSSPAGGRLPKWNPPGLVGNSPTSCQSAPVKSPGLGLRLGLSRLARVKPLHCNAAAH